MENHDNRPIGEPVTVHKWPTLETLERRILGVLIEKAKTTPEAYPLSVNSLVNGSNQKSNRDPLMNLDDSQVESVIRSCVAKGLVSLVRGGRVERWQHELYSKWNLSKRDMSIIGELLLRGPQSEGLLRTRAGRMETFDSLEDLREALDSLASRNLIYWVDNKGSRGARVTHGFHSPEELVRIKSTSVSISSDDDQPIRSTKDSSGLRDLITNLQIEVNNLRAELETLKKQLGV